MLEYHLPCLAGAPRQLESLQTVELACFAVIRDDEKRVTGFAISDQEISTPVLALFNDREQHKIWLRPEDPSLIYFIPTDMVPLDALDALSLANRTEKPVSVYSLAVDGTNDAPRQGAT